MTFSPGRHSNPSQVDATILVIASWMRCLRGLSNSFPETILAHHHPVDATGTNPQTEHDP